MKFKNPQSIASPIAKIKKYPRASLKKDLDLFSVSLAELTILRGRPSIASHTSSIIFFAKSKGASKNSWYFLPRLYFARTLKTSCSEPLFHSYFYQLCWLINYKFTYL